MLKLPESFKELAKYKQFVPYKIIESKSRPGKTDKIPYCLKTNSPLKWGNENTWMSAAEALDLNLPQDFGVGFVFTKNDPFFCIDIDTCLIENDWSILAKDLCAKFQGAAVEISSSGKGLHIIGTGLINAHGCKNIENNLEFYTQDRFIALTGTNVTGCSSYDCTGQLSWLIDAYFSNRKNNKDGDLINRWETQVTAGVDERWNGISDDDALLTKMLQHASPKSVFGSSISFADLWNADEEALEKFYGNDRSSIDAALAQRLAFWTGNDCARMQRLMMQSELHREKWDREDYLQRTILFACENQKEFHSTGARSETQETNIDIGRFLGLEGQLLKFSGCTYITSSHRVLTPNGYELTPEQFKAAYGGCIYVLDPQNQKITTDAFKAFTQSQLCDFPKARTTVFKPTEAPGALIERQGEILVNSYWPIKTLSKKGDATPFRKNLDIMIGNDRDVAILTSYLAAQVQYLGVKFGWCIFLQGVEGNGKSLIGMCMQNILGDRYCRYPKAKEITSNFNAYLDKALLIIVEDIYDGSREVIECLKPMITSTRQDIEPKGIDKITKDICCNFIINSNYKNGIKQDKNARRFAPFYTRQQSPEDLIRDGLTEEHFFKYTRWLKSNDGFAKVKYYLENYEIPDEFNPATMCVRAPITSSTEEAVAESVGSIEQEILEAVAQETPGFKGGWISSIMLNQLIVSTLKAKIPLNRRKDLLSSLGYTPHPGLKEGRVNNIVQPDCGKPRLFVQKDHAARHIIGAAEIAKAYVSAQS